MVKGISEWHETESSTANVTDYPLAYKNLNF